MRTLQQTWRRAARTLARPRARALALSCAALFALVAAADGGCNKAAPDASNAAGGGSTSGPGPKAAHVHVSVTVDVPGGGSADVFFGGKKIGGKSSATIDADVPPSADRYVLAGVPGAKTVWMTVLSNDRGTIQSAGLVGAQLTINARTTAAAYVQLLPDFLAEMGETNAIVSKAVWASPKLDAAAAQLKANPDPTAPAFISAVHDVAVDVRATLNAQAAAIFASAAPPAGPMTAFDLHYEPKKYSAWGETENPDAFTTSWNTAPDLKTIALSYGRGGLVPDVQKYVSLYALDGFVLFGEIDESTVPAMGTIDLGVDRHYTIKPGSRHVNALEAATPLDWIDVFHVAADGLQAAMGLSAPEATAPTIDLTRPGAYSVRFLSGALGVPNWSQQRDFIAKDADLQALWSGAFLRNCAKIGFKLASMAGAELIGGKGLATDFANKALEKLTVQSFSEPSLFTIDRLGEITAAFRDAAIETLTEKPIEAVAKAWYQIAFDVTENVAKGVIDAPGKLSDGLNAFAVGTQLPGFAPMVAQVIVVGPRPVALALAQDPWDITIDDSRVYWLNDGYGNNGTVLSVPIFGGTPTVLVSGLKYANSIAVDATSLYWATETSCSPAGGNGVIWKAPKAGGLPTVLASGQRCPHAVMIHKNDLFWINDYSSGGGPEVYKLPVMGGNPAVLTSSSDPQALHSYKLLASDSMSVYWIDSFTSDNQNYHYDVTKVEISGGVATTLAAQAPVNADGDFGLAVDETTVYWGAWFGMNAGGINRISKLGGAATTVISGGFWPTSLALDGTSIYWTGVGNGDSDRIMKVAKGGGSATALVFGQDDPGRILVDNANIYWFNWGMRNGDDSIVPHTGGVMKLAKP